MTEMPSRRAHRFETAEMRSHEQHPAIVEDLRADDFDVEEIESVLQEIDAVVQRRGEGEEDAELIAEGGPAPAHVAKEFTSG
jgi:hypothetical protein